VSRPALEVADIFCSHGPVWRKANAGHVNLDQLKVMSAIERCLDKAAGIARAANACAGTGFYDKAVEITLDIEQPIYEVTTLLNATSLIHRISKPG